MCSLVRSFVRSLARRNIHRGSPSAFAFDRYSAPIVTQLLGNLAPDGGGGSGSTISGRAGSGSSDLLIDLRMPGRGAEEEEEEEEEEEGLALFERFFLLMPLEHSEIPAEQAAGVALNRTLLEEAQAQAQAALRGEREAAACTGTGGSRGEEEEGVVEYLARAVHDKAGRAVLIQHYGRYPPRNEALGRESTAAEAEYLAARETAMADGAAEGKDLSNYIHLPPPEPLPPPGCDAVGAVATASKL
jgi:uncharacterized protein (DUF924 family)